MLSPSAPDPKRLAEQTSIEQLIEKAKALSPHGGEFLLVFDIIDSRNHRGFRSVLELFRYFHAALEAVNEEFSAEFPLNKLRNGIDLDRGFVVIHGDAAVACINNPEAIREIVAFFGSEYPKIHLRWSVAEDGWDREGLAITR